MPCLQGRRVRRFFLEGISRDDRSVCVRGDEFYHLARVLRLKEHAEVALFDGRGLELSGTIAALDDEQARIEVTGVSEGGGESPLEITLLQAVTKGGKMDLIIQKGTEIGVASFRPFFSDRTVPKAGAGAKAGAKRSARWRKIALEAAKQCGRSVIPAIGEPAPFEEVLAGFDDALKLMPWEMEQERGLRETVRDYGKAGVEKAAILIGPEGGLTEEDVATARRHGFMAVSLGPRILRAETAAIAAIAVVQHCLGDMG